MAVESLSGHWWEPKAPDRKLAGTLEVAEDGSMVLTVSGMLPVAEVINLAAEPLDVVFGELQDGRCVTLADAIGGFPSAARGRVWSQVLPELALVGETHVTDPTDSPAFNGVIAQVAGLEEVVGGMRLEIEDGDGSSGVLRYAADDDVEVDLGDGERLTIATRMNRTHEGTTSTLTTVAIIEAEGHAAPFRETLRRVSPIRDLLTFALAQPTTFRSIEVRTVDGDVLRPIFRPDRTPIEAVRLGQRLVPPIPRSRLADVVRAWYAASRGDLRHIVNIHLASLYRGQIFGETRFELAVQSVEGLHRTAYPDEVHEPVETYEARCARILGQLEGSDRKLVKRLLKWANEPSLAERISALMKTLPFVEQELHIDRAWFPTRMASIRNDLAHAKPGASERDPYELRALAESCRTYVNAYLLSALGYPEAEVRSAIRTDRGAGIAASWWMARSRE